MIMFIVSHNCQFSWKWKSFNVLEFKISSAKLPVNNQLPFNFAIPHILHSLTTVTQIQLDELFIEL